MPRQNITEKTEAEVLATNTGKFFRAVSAETGVIRGTFAGKHVCMVAVAVNSQLTEAQMDSLETQIEAINGVFKSFVLIGPARIPTDRVPADHDLKMRVEGSFTIEPTL